MDSVIRAAEALLSLLQQKKLTLAVAEGSSGGALSQALTALPGASAVFQAGIVGYSDSAKYLRLLRIRSAGSNPGMGGGMY